uniref:Carbonic anhydrase n=1 Tax=Culex tarsalis TaxID=7177 RepID=A0A1Q3FI69_CULTA
MRLSRCVQQWILLNTLVLLPWVSCTRLETIPDSGEDFPRLSTRRSVSFREDVNRDENGEGPVRPLFRQRVPPVRSTTSVNRDFYFPGPTTRRRVTTVPAGRNPDTYFENIREESRQPGRSSGAGRDRPRAAAGGAEFSYIEKDKNGPSNWYRIAPQCGGRYQSPIMLNTSSALYVRNKRPLQLVGQTNLPQAIRLENDGHSAKFTYVWNEGDRPYIRGGPLKTKYFFEQFHFHWGSNESLGSEHVLDYHRFPMELHLVFYNGLYSSFEDARNEVDGLVVVGMFYEMYDRFNEQLNTWTRFLQEVITPESTFTIQFIDTFPLYDVIGDFEWPYFSYEGSLTTPPCLETVTWIVSAKPLLITAREMREFRRIRNRNGAPMVNNFRPVQKLYNRRVFRY